MLRRNITGVKAGLGLRSNPYPSRVGRVLHRVGVTVSTRRTLPLDGRCPWPSRSRRRGIWSAHSATVHPVRGIIPHQTTTQGRESGRTGRGSYHIAVKTAIFAMTIH